MGFERLEPSGSLREDTRFGLIASLMLNSNPYLKQSARRFKPSDFFPELDPERARLRKEEKPMSVGEKFNLWVKTMMKAGVAKEVK